MLAGPAPEVLIGPIAAATRRIRVGSGGVMLPHYSPLKVAESFSLLSGLYPGRIDLGLGRAAGTDPMTTYALQRDRRQASPDDFPDQLAELLAYLEDDAPARPPVRAPRALAAGPPEAPEPWLLGSSPQSGIWAAELGLPYAFADFINRDGAGIATDYQRSFDPGVRLRRAAHRGRDLGARRRHGGGGLAAHRLEPHGDDDAAARAADRRPAGRAGAALPRVRGRARRRRLAPHHRGHARAGPRRPRDDRRSSTAPTR